MNRTSALTTLAAVATLAHAPATLAGFSVTEASGANAAAIQTSVDAFRSALGPLNPNNLSAFASGRREINWDGVPDADADPNPFAGDFFASTSIGGRARGIDFSTPGTSLLVSADSSNPSTTSTGFGFSGDLSTFSAERLFSPVGSSLLDITFYQPGTTTQATVSGFGAVFTDVEINGSTSLLAYDADDNLLFTRSVLTSANAGFSFLGIQATAGETIARIRLDLGDNRLLANGSLFNADDLVVVDDFIYAEPQPLAGAVPEPATLGFGLLGLTGAIGWNLRRRLARR